jgi:hypothetical protein
VAESTTFREDSSASSSSPNLNLLMASTTLAVPPTIPYRRPLGSRLANVSNTHCRSAVPAASAAATMVSS